MGASPTWAPARERVVGIDLARALAVLGMLAVHVGPTDAEGLGGALYGLTHGRAAILFGLLAGVGVSLLARSRSASTGDTRVRLVWRAVVLLPLGLALQELDHNVFVILQDYALLFLLGAALVTVPDRWLWPLAAVSWLGGSVLYVAGGVWWPEAFVRDVVVWGLPPGELLHRLVLSGPYPLITWTAPFVVGMVLGRRDLTAPSVVRRLVWVGAVLAVAAPLASWALRRRLALPEEVGGLARLALDEPHGQTPLWLLGATGAAVLVLGASIWVGARVPRTVWPLAAVGQLAFTVYVVHLLALHLDRDALTSDAVGEATLLVGGFTLVAAAFAVAWRALLRRGPLELVLHLPALGQERRTRVAYGGHDPGRSHQGRPDDDEHPRPDLPW